MEDGGHFSRRRIKTLTLNLSYFSASHLELVADADEAEFSRLLLHVFAVVGVFEEFSYKAVLGLADQTLQRHVQRVVVLLHKLGLREGHFLKNSLRNMSADTRDVLQCPARLCFSYTNISISKSYHFFFQFSFFSWLFMTYPAPATSAHFTGEATNRIHKI